ncbi:MAG: sterol desaturase family protein [Bacteroidota bacterium]|nr:sterol desaturase family protein [Candidatus Kapabacteria bacterium]MDW8220350.1 sterol desaturase family protein [Bacteroidota bacterium]
MDAHRIQAHTQATAKARFVSNKDETVRLFNNPLLEYFSHIHPATPLVTFIPVALITAYLSIQDVGGLPTCGLFAIGILFWTLTEYILHRWVFHYHPKSELGQKVHFLIHGVHHDYPRDSTRLVMPLLVSVPLAALFYSAFVFALQQYANGAFCGFIVGYMLYDSIHYATHHLPMKGKIGRFLKTYHMRHHYQDSDTAYGVSSPLWDYIIGTVPEHLKNDAKSAEYNAKEQL